MKKQNLTSKINEVKFFGLFLNRCKEDIKWLKTF